MPQSAIFRFLHYENNSDINNSDIINHLRLIFKYTYLIQGNIRN